MINKGTKTIETERLLLRKFQYEDADDMIEYWISDENIQSMYCEPIYITKEEVNELLSKYINSYEKEDYYRWAIILKETNECIGQIAFFLVNNESNFSEIEYCIGSKYQRRGFATEATKAIMDFGFNEVNFHKIQISHREGNEASKSVIEKCCFKYEGMLRDFIYYKNRYYGRAYYSLLKDEYMNNTNKN